MARRLIGMIVAALAAAAAAAPGSYSGNVEPSDGPSIWWLNLIWIAALLWYWISKDDTP
jgi:hypothetical protein